MKKLVSALMAVAALLSVQAQEQAVDLSKLSWGHIALKMPDQWYGTPEALALADTVLAAEMPCGGWFKNLPYHKLGEEHHHQIVKSQKTGSAIFDNDATTTEMRFLAKVYAHYPEQRFADAFRRALELIFDAQYDNGGWPMFYPLSEECIHVYGVRDPVSGKKYVGHITFNDNAVVNNMRILRDVRDRKAGFEALTDENDVRRAEKAFFDAVQCILDCQIRGTYEQYEFARTDDGVILGDRRTGDGPLTVWCAQHDAVTLEPAQARAYEFPSYSGGESAAILKLLMQIKPKEIPADRPEMWEAIKSSITAAMEWFDAHRIEGKRFISTKTPDGQRDRALVDAPGERNLWARFYELTSCRPIFGMYDFVRQYDLGGVSPKRRSGYAWYTDAMADVFVKYEKWREKYLDK